MIHLKIGHWGAGEHDELMPLSVWMPATVASTTSNQHKKRPLPWFSRDFVEDSVDWKRRQGIVRFQHDLQFAVLVADSRD